MCEIIAVTNRLLFPDKTAFLLQLQKIADSGVSAIVLREKDLSPNDYEALLVDVISAVRRVRVIPHTFAMAATLIGCRRIHLPWNIFAEQFPNDSKTPLWAGLKTMEFGVSVHKPEEAVIAARRGAAWVIAGHVFSTQSKKGLEARGLEFLADVCRKSPVPVYAIGGINEENAAAVAETGVKGLCLMSSLMESENPRALVAAINNALLEE